MIKLYGFKGAGQVCAQVVLEAAGLKNGKDYEVIMVERDANKKIPESYRDINPAMLIPTIIMNDGLKITESGAIMIYLAEALPQANLGADNLAMKADMLQLIFFIASSVYPNAIRGYYSDRYSSDSSHSEGIKTMAIKKLHENMQVLSQKLANNQYLLGNKYSVVDIYFAMLYAFYLDLVPSDLPKFANLQAYYARLCANPTIRAIWQDGELPVL